MIKLIKWLLLLVLISLCFFLYAYYTSQQSIISDSQYESLLINKGDSTISLNTFLIQNTKTLLIYFHPDCNLCHELLRQIPSINEGTKVILLSHAEKNSIESYLLNEHLVLNEHIYLIYDSLLLWSEKIKINVIPTTIYYKHNQFQIKRTGVFEINRLIN
jgi:hypothetical protein